MPTDKRARHKAYRQAKVAELRRAQQRRRNLRRGAVVGAVVVVALVLAGLSTLGGGKKKTPVATATPTTTKAPTSTTTPSTTVPGTGVSPLPLTSLEAALIPRTPPAVSSSCAATGTTSTSTPTTTVPAKGPAVAVIPAPSGVGFPKLDGSSPHYTKFSSPPPFCINVADTYTASMVTTAGTMTFTLLPKYAPQTVNSFVFLAGYHFFDGIIFHRVITDFVDQAGDPLGTGAGGPGYTIADEYPKTAAAYDTGSLAMANTGQPHTGGSQFFITVGNGGKQLQPSYSVFGQLTGGLPVAEKINAGGSSGGTPTTTYKILKVSITASGPAPAVG